MDLLENCFNYFNKIPKSSIKLQKNSLFLSSQPSVLDDPDSLPTFRLPLVLLSVCSIAIDSWQQTAVSYSIDFQSDLPHLNS